MCTWEMTSPVLLPSATIEVTSNPCKVLLPLCITSDGLIHYQTLSMLVVPFLRSMRHLCLSCNGSAFAVMPTRISLTLPEMGPRPRFSQFGPIVGFHFALKQAHQVLLTDFGCHEWSIDGPAPASAVPQIAGSSPNPAANAP